MRRRHGGTIVAGLALALLLPACNGSLPTEPEQAAVARLRLDAAPGGPTGTVTVTNGTCVCLDQPLEVRIDGQPAGTLPCDGEAQFPVSDASFTVTVSTAGSTVTYRHEQQEAGTASGVHLTVSCRAS